MAPLPTDRLTRWITLIGLLGFLFLASIGLQMPFASPSGIADDEAAHLSYALQLRDAHFVGPAIDRLVFYDADTRLPTARGSYLNHPATAYYPLATLLELWPHASITAIRLFCFLPALLGYVIYLRIGRESRLGLAAYALYAWLPSLLCLPVSTALVTIDGWGLLGGSLLTLGVLRKQQVIAGWPRLMAMGLLFASVKLNSWLFAGMFAVLAIAMEAAPMRVRLRQLIRLALGGVLLSAPYLLLWWQWGSPAPDTPAQITLLKHGTDGVADALLYHGEGFVAYVWFGLCSFTRYLNFAALHGMYVVLYAVLLAFIVRQWALTFVGSRQPIVGKAAAWAWLFTFAIHVSYSYQHYLQYRWQLDFYPRYYLVALPGLGLVFAQGVEYLIRLHCKSTGVARG